MTISEESRNHNRDRSNHEEGERTEDTYTSPVVGSVARGEFRVRRERTMSDQDHVPRSSGSGSDSCGNSTSGIGGSSS